MIVDSTLVVMYLFESRQATSPGIHFLFVITELEIGLNIIIGVVQNFCKAANSATLIHRNRYLNEFTREKYIVFESVIRIIDNADKKIRKSLVQGEKNTFIIIYFRECFSMYDKIYTYHVFSLFFKHLFSILLHIHLLKIVLQL